MPTYFQRPENALKRANEFIDVGKKQVRLGEDAIVCTMSLRSRSQYTTLRSMKLTSRYRTIFQRALDALYDVIKSKKRNHQYSEKLIEQIMNKYLELCVDLKKSHVAKEGLFQYRNMTQATNVASLASVVQTYLSMAEKR